MATLVIFARLPVPGKVKTRLAASVGPEMACTFYKAMAEHIIKTAHSVTGLQITLYHSHGDETHSVQQWMRSFINQEVDVLAQVSSTDLGYKMYNAMSESLSKGGNDRVLIVGTDIPDITEQIIKGALHALDNHEMVIGPAHDGGYYLLGFKGKVDIGVFQGIEWSTNTVLSETLKRALKAGIVVAPLDTLPTLQDIDTIHDMQSWLHQFSSQGQAWEQSETARPSMEIRQKSHHALQDQAREICNMFMMTHKELEKDDI